MLNILGAGLIGMQVIDTFLTMWAIRFAGATEINPLMAPIAHTWVSPLVKIMPVLVVAALLHLPVVRQNRTYRLAGNIGMVGGIAFLVWITCQNVAELL